MQGYVCRCCGTYYDELPLRYGAKAPDYYYYAMPESQRDSRSLLSTDQCVVDQQYYFLSGDLEIPIIGSEQVFTWRIWVSPSERRFKRAMQVWNQQGRETEPPFFGWLSNRIPSYPETLHLKTNLHTRPVGSSFLIELEPTNHPLAIEQREGITLARVEEVAVRFCTTRSTDTLSFWRKVWRRL
jgi:hypothetical protein